MWQEHQYQVESGGAQNMDTSTMCQCTTKAGNACKNKTVFITLIDGTKQRSRYCRLHIARCGNSEITVDSTSVQASRCACTVEDAEGNEYRCPNLATTVDDEGFNDGEDSAAIGVCAAHSKRGACRRPTITTAYVPWTSERAEAPVPAIALVGDEQLRIPYLLHTRPPCSVEDCKRESVYQTRSPYPVCAQHFTTDVRELAKQFKSRNGWPTIGSAVSTVAAPKPDTAAVTAKEVAEYNRQQEQDARDMAEAMKEARKLFSEAPPGYRW
jgi:hypothetical protein